MEEKRKEPKISSEKKITELGKSEVTTIKITQNAKAELDAIKTDISGEEKITEPGKSDVTTIKIPLDVKAELDAIKTDQGESYAGVVSRLIPKTQKSDGDMITIRISKRVFQMMMMVLPDNLKRAVRGGVKK